MRHLPLSLINKHFHGTVEILEIKQWSMMASAEVMYHIIDQLLSVRIRFKYFKVLKNMVILYLFFRHMGQKGGRRNVGLIGRKLRTKLWK